MSHTQPLVLRFNGRAGEYFGIWIVNLLLSIVTLGIYSAWAKVRKLKYFHGNTVLADAAFDYTASPMAILKGRLIAVALLIVYSVVNELSPLFGGIAMLLLFAAMPWLVVRSLRFQLRNTTYRNVRFDFDGSVGGAALTMLLLPFLAVLSLGLLLPYAVRQQNRYIADHVMFGSSRFKLDVGVAPFYWLYLKAFGWLLLSLALLAAAGYQLSSGFAGSGNPAADKQMFMQYFLIGYAGLYLLGFFIYVYVQAHMTNLVWNNASLAGHRFASSLKPGKLLGIYLGNMLAMIATLGLFTPVAAIRLARYRVENLALLPAGDLDNFNAIHFGTKSATGEEISDAFDLDVAL